MTGFTGAQLVVAALVLGGFVFDVLSFEFTVVMLLFLIFAELCIAREGRQSVTHE